MKKTKTSLVLEGGGMRGAYTAGALSWLLDNNIEFDNAYGISTGGIHLCNYLTKDNENLFKFPIDYIKDKNAVGMRAFLRCGRLVDYDYLFKELLEKQVKYDLSKLKKIKTIGKIGLYDLNEGKTIFKEVKDVTYKDLQAACTLPVIGKPVKIDDNYYFDGGITEQIPINQAILDGCNKSLIITTKPVSYVRKKSKGIVVFLMKVLYKKWPSVASDYSIRHLNYQKQIKTVNDMAKDGNVIYICPSTVSNVSRLGGSRQDLISLYELGRSDMQAREKEILAAFKKK